MPVLRTFEAEIVPTLAKNWLTHEINSFDDELTSFRVRTVSEILIALDERLSDEDLISLGECLTLVSSFVSVAGVIILSFNDVQDSSVINSHLTFRLHTS
jgi:hypothetical protein